MRPPETAHNRFGTSRTAVIAPEDGSNAPQTHANACMGPARFDREALKLGFSPKVNKGGIR